MNRVAVWLKTVWGWLVPPADHDWPLVAFQPVFFTSMWIAAWIQLVFGDSTANPPELRDTAAGMMGPLWMGLMLICPPLALHSSLLVRHGGRSGYRGKWLRLGADAAMLLALLDYTVMRLTMGDYHIIPVAALLSGVVFTALLVIRDVRNLNTNEHLAARLYKTTGDNVGERAARTQWNTQILDELAALHRRTRDLANELRQGP